MEKFIIIVGIAVIATLTVNAGKVITWADDFNGADGTVVAPGVNWGYTNMGQLVGSAENPVVPRPDSDDRHYITNNTLYCYTGPATNNLSVYNKVMSTIYPKTDGTPVYVNLTNGILTVEWDLVNMTQNNGAGWLGQEMKVSLSPVPVHKDPYNNTTNLYMVTMGIPQSSYGYYYLYSSAKQSGGKTNGKILAYTDFNTPVTPVTFKMVLKSDTTFLCYINDALFGITNSAMPAFENVYIQVWHGMFSCAGGTEVSDGNIELDNFSVTWIPEPSVFLLILLTFPLWRKT